MRFELQLRIPCAALVLGMLFSIGLPAASAQTASQSGSGASAASPQYDPYQRSGDVFYMNRFAKTGWERGKEIWYMKCWICHNDYTREANNPSEGPVAPTLKELYKRPVLLSGKPVNDETVKDHIREGSRQMPGYKYVLTDKDLNDLVEYLRDHCCWDEQNPPPNPRFREQ
jgi:mono/diheme cytochrome c family protein